MNDVAANLFTNPELIRYVRSQLRRGRVIAVVVICAALSFTIGSAMKAAYGNSASASVWALEFLKVIFRIQVTALLIGGGIACLQAISREKDLNTFDFQRVTRLSPLELSVGKLFGAPILAYFVAFCFMPAALIGAFLGGARPSFVFAAYVILFLGSVCAHCFCLVISLVIERNAATGAALLFLFAVGFFSSPTYGIFDLAELGPYYATSLLSESDWSVALKAPPPLVGRFSATQLADLFFSTPVPHPLVLIVLYLSFLAWYLLALSRNIKRDPSAYELFSPPQSLGLLLYVNFLLLGFFSWRTLDPLDSQSFLLGLNAFCFFILGVVLLRNRDRFRRRLRELRAKVPGWLEATWPAPYLLAGSLLVCFAALGMIDHTRDPKKAWDWSLAMFRLVFFSLWLVRDSLYLQWMNLSRSKRPLPMALLYLLVFYFCVNIFYGFANFKDHSGQAVFFPAMVLGLEPPAWAKDQVIWTFAMLLQFLPIVVFIFLQHLRLEKLSSPAPSLRAAPSAASD